MVLPNVISFAQTVRHKMKIILGLLTLHITPSSAGMASQIIPSVLPLMYWSRVIIRCRMCVAVRGYAHLPSWLEFSTCQFNLANIVIIVGISGRLGWVLCRLIPYVKVWFYFLSNLVCWSLRAILLAFVFWARFVLRWSNGWTSPLDCDGALHSFHIIF